MKEINRRNLILSSVGTLAGFAGIKALADSFCPITVPQGEGPYYPENDLNRDNDLTQHTIGMPFAKGQVIEIHGQVTNQNCNEIPDALVEIWQACESGKYNHSEDPNNLPLDPNFQYWGRCRTDKKGEYLFRSVIPGHYPVGVNRFRPPHIHYKVHAPHFHSLTTQLYFDPKTYDDPALKAIVKELNAIENVDRRLMVLFEQKPSNPMIKVGKFNIVLRPM